MSKFVIPREDGIPGRRISHSISPPHPQKPRRPAIHKPRRASQVTISADHPQTCFEFGCSTASHVRRASLAASGGKVFGVWSAAQSGAPPLPPLPPLTPSAPLPPFNPLAPFVPLAPSIRFLPLSETADGCLEQPNNSDASNVTIIMDVRFIINYARARLRQAQTARHRVNPDKNAKNKR